MTWSDSEISALVEPDRMHRMAYTDPEIFELEMERIFRRLPLMLAFSCELREAGSYKSMVAADVPLVEQIDNPTTRMWHYSGHDTTIVPHAAALGHKDLLLPLFGQTIITELVFDPSKMINSAAPPSDAAAAPMRNRPCTAAT